MGFWLLDLEDETIRLKVNAWNWHATVEIVRRAHLIPEDELEFMAFTGGGGTATQEQARAIAAHVTGIVGQLGQGHRVMLDGRVETSADDGTLHRDDLEANYSASREWLEKFVEFYARCNGFKVD